jgi:parallel beta-helix repeat protein
MSALLLCSVAKADIKDTIQNAKSGTTVQCSGTYSETGPIKVPSGVTVKGPATFNFNSTGNNGFELYSSGSQLISITVAGSSHHGIDIQGSSCKVTSCNASGSINDGIMLDSGSKNNTISGCSASGNLTGNGDGIGVKNGASSGNSIVNSTAHNNYDDGFDFYGAESPVSVSGCQAYSNGTGSGNGVGFKMGGSYNAAHTYTSCTAHNETGSPGRGFDTNHNTAKIQLNTCHSYSNKNNDELGNCVLNNCTMQQ